MARADLLVSLVRSGSRGDHNAFKKVTDALIAEENAKGHKVLAQKLQESTLLKKNHINKQPPSNLFYETTPARQLNELMLSESTQEQVKELIEEQHRSELLHSYNLNARNKILLVGSPGNGKTTLAEAIATELMYPLITIRYESLIGSFLGETANRLKQIIEYVKTKRCVLFIDEFETIGKERGDNHETGEIKRVVSSLLLQIDDLPDYVVVIAASNHPELLDRAVWRRFQIRIELPKPSKQQIQSYISYLSNKWDMKFGYSVEKLAEKLAGANFAEIEELFQSIVRRAILDRKTNAVRTITTKKLKQWDSRCNIKSKN